MLPKNGTLSTQRWILVKTLDMEGFYEGNLHIWVPKSKQRIQRGAKARASVKRTKCHEVKGTIWRIMGMKEEKMRAQR